MSDQKAKWAVELIGSPKHLEVWRNWLVPGFDPAIIELSDREPKTIALTSDNFADVEDEKTLNDIAVGFVKAIKGAIYAADRPTDVTAGCVIKLEPDGSIKRRYFINVGPIVFESPVVRGSGQVFDKNGKLVVAPPTATLVQKAISLTTNHDLLRHALVDLDADMDWFALYRIYECLHKQGALPNFHPKAEIDRFKKTANGFGIRHRKGMYIDPKNPMHIVAARVFIRRWAEAVLSALAK